MGLTVSSMSNHNNAPSTISDSSIKSSSSDFSGSSSVDEHVEIAQQKTSNIQYNENCKYNTIDAAVNDYAEVNIPIQLNKLTIKHIFDIENALEYYEKISLVFLLFEDTVKALKILEADVETNILEKWVQNEIRTGNKWQNKIVEAIAIIKNYQILKQFGFTNDELNSRYLPNCPYTALSVSKRRKSIYLICEKLVIEDTERFLTCIERDFIAKRLSFPFRRFNPKYLEKYFLYWDSIGYISNNYDNIIAIFKTLEFDEIYDILKKVSENLNLDNIKIERQFSKKSERVLNVADPTNSQLNKTLRLENRYRIDPKNPGVCLIINQQNFYTEIDKECLHLLPESIRRGIQLEERIGTNIDKDHLETTFKSFGFNVIVKKNRDHVDLVQDIKEVVEKIKDESSLFVCILSHGEEGVIYGCNSCKVEVKSIQKIMCQQKWQYLNGKPKVLILQSCQGGECQEMPNEDDDLTLDGPIANQAVPITSDMLTFWATLPGYAAFRNKKSGTWFIQSFCKKLIELGHTHHLEDICTKIMDDITSKKWEREEQRDAVMVPVKVSTLRKAFYLAK